MVLFFTAFLSIIVVVVVNEFALLVLILTGGNFPDFAKIIRTNGIAHSMELKFHMSEIARKLL